jgi:RNA polymerase sigma-70 factor (ECF subfamily)
MTDREAIPADDHFIAMLTKHQVQLRGYILASLGHHANAEDVLQRTNLVLWRKAGEFHKGADFLPWAITVARYEILAFLRDHGRDRLVFSQDVLDVVSQAAEKRLVSMPARQEALRVCLDKLSDENRDMLNRKYVHLHSSAQLADATGRSADAVKSLMLRIRRRVSDCVEQQLRRAGT